MDERRSKLMEERISRLARLAGCTVLQRKSCFMIKPRQASEGDRGPWMEAMKTRREVLAFLRGFVRGKSQASATQEGTMTILNDQQIAKLCTGDKPMIFPFEPKQLGKPTYGLGSFGYDIRLGSKFMVHKAGVNFVLDPKNFPKEFFTVYEATDYFDIAPHMNVLAESVEWFDMPDDVMGIACGKSTYARCGLLCNLTPLEPSWKGRLTLELANLSPLPIRLYVGQGIAQIIFFRGVRPKRVYSEKEAGGRYQCQPGVMLPG